MQNNSESKSDVLFLRFSSSNDRRVYKQKMEPVFLFICNGNVEQGASLLCLLKVSCTEGLGCGWAHLGHENIFEGLILWHHVKINNQT